MIHFISGKPRGGKSLYAVKLAVEELVHGDRVVITNLPLRLDVLNEYLQRKFPNARVNLRRRVILLDDSETGVFWTIRPNGFRVPKLSKEEWKNGKLPSYAGRTDYGVLYIIDEIHNYFGARAWMETGRDVLFYISQHGKLSDTLVCVTQAIQNVDRQFRSVAQDFTYLRNLKKEKMGFFRMPGLFLRKTFLSPATGSTDKAVESGCFTLDVSGLAACYDTSQGVGIHGGRGADKGEGRKGVHWAAFVIIVPIVVFCFFKLMPNLIAKVFVPDRGIPNPVQVVKSGVQAGAAAGVGALKGTNEVHQAGSNQVVRVPVRISGMTRIGEKIVVGLTDGRTYRWPSDRELQHVGKDFAIINGEMFKWY